MILNDYAEFKSISIGELMTLVNNSRELILKDLSKYRVEKMDYFYYNSINLPLDTLRSNFNLTKESMVSKFNLFSPYLLSMIIESEHKKVLEFMCGTSIFSEMLSEYGKDVTYASVESEYLNFIKWRVNHRNLNIKVEEVSRNFKLNDKYDFILSDGVLQLFNDSSRYKIIDSMVDSVNKDGVIAILVDWTGKGENPYNYDIDVGEIHDYLDRKELVCVYGKNTFSSLWKKMI